MGKVSLGNKGKPTTYRHVDPVVKTIIKEVPVEVIKEVFITKEIEVKVPVEVIREVIKEVQVMVPMETIKEVPIETIKEIEVVKTIKVHDIEPVLEQKDKVRRLERKNAVLQVILTIVSILCIGGWLHG